MNPEPYNPLDKRHLGENVADALLASQSYPLADVPKFKGAGIYAIYFTGDQPEFYQGISTHNKEDALRWPIYVGKAIPKGARKGQVGLDAPTGTVMWNRLRQHRDSIVAAEDLDIADFRCQFLVVDDIWIPLGEALLIARFSPVWNTLVDGFGNHDPGKGRHAGLRPRWDVLHPGRVWAPRFAERPESRDQIISEVMAAIAQSTVHTNGS